METHPVTTFIGILGAIFLFVLVGIGMSCILYKFESENYPLLQPLYEYAKQKKVC